eukprot:gene41545-50699_t
MIEATEAIELEKETISLERVPTKIYKDAAEASKAVAQEIAKIIRKKNASGKPAVLGLATGSTQKKVYAELIRLHKSEGLSFENVITFNLDEYYPMQPDAVQSYHRFMKEQLFDHVNIAPENCHIPTGTLPLEKLAIFCKEYEAQIEELGGLDIQILGIGRNGHIGFNEPGSLVNSRTRLMTLDITTRMDAAGDFDDDIISMGGTFQRLHDQGHDVHVAYQTSGNIAVADDEALRFAEFVVDFNERFEANNAKANRIYREAAKFLKAKKDSEIDTPEYLFHFLDMPFYETGTVQKNPIGEADVEIVLNLIEEIQPHQIYAAGDYSAFPRLP